MKKIVFINQDAGYLMIDIVNAHVAKGYECVLITGRLVERNTKLSEAVKIEKIVAYNRTTVFRRIYSWLMSFFQIFFKLLIKYKQYELFIVSNPPFATLLPLFLKRKYRLLIYDIYPDALSELGFIRKEGLIDKLWQRANKKVYKNADRIYCLTEGMKCLLEKYCTTIHPEVVSVWTDNSFFRPIEKNKNPFLKEEGIESKFIVLYSGNIGLTGNVDMLMKIAEKLKTYSEILFLIIGEGPKKNEIIKEKEQKQLDNVKLMDWQPTGRLPYTMSSADVAVVSLGNKMSKLAIPSKTFNYMSVGAPILCMTESDSELSSLLIKYQCGQSFDPADVLSMAEYILRLYNDKELRKKMSSNSLAATIDFDKKNADLFII